VGGILAKEAESTTNLTYEKLFELLRAEKNNASLQKLSDSFFEDVGIYIESKLAVIKKNESSENVFSAKEQEETSKQLANAKKIIKMLYDLREKKIVTMALNKSRTASSLIDTSGLHREEATIFKDFVELLDNYRKDILNHLLDGKQAKTTTEKPTKKEKPAAKADADDMQMIRLLDAVEEFVDPEMNTYGPFQEEDIANLPKDVAKLLIDKNKAQPIDPA
jgi:DNA replication initiation complex subunit (GINS family)